ncbi:MAG TPA: FAD-dependent oxidoreductase [Gemmatimonadales bacterium]|nr:FAD-dependent oxidoreductase [Gemmatimonadales bacterium]
MAGRAPRYSYLIIGGGMTADAAVAGIREADAAGTIGLISAEPHPPYNRPPLSKGLWKGEAEESIWRTAAKAGAELHLGRRAIALDPARHAVTDDQGVVYSFDKLLLATGGRARRLPLDGGQIIYFRTLDDYRRLRLLAAQDVRFAVVGGGFIGSEVAAALRMQGRDVVMLVPEAGLGARVFPADLSRFLVDYYRDKGVDMRMGVGMTGVESSGGECVVRTTTGREVAADVVVAGLGIEAGVELAVQAGLRVDNGIEVDELCRTSHRNIYAGGDVANFFNLALGSRMRVEHEDNANTMGRIAGQNMAGQEVPYHHVPFFYSDLFELGYEAVGDVDARLETVADWRTQFREGVVYYLKDGRVRGVLLWNTWGQVDAARALIAERGPLTPQQLEGRLPR